MNNIMKNKYRKFQCNRFILTKDIMSQSYIHLYEMTEQRKMAAKSKNVVYFDKTSYNINISNLSPTRTIRIIFFIICILYYDFFLFIFELSWAASTAFLTLPLSNFQKEPVSNPHH